MFAVIRCTLLKKDTRDLNDENDSQTESQVDSNEIGWGLRTPIPPGPQVLKCDDKKFSTFLNGLSERV